MIRFTPWTTVEETTEMADKLSRYVFDLVDFQEFPLRVGQVQCFIDTIGMIVGVSEVAYVHLPSSQTATAKRVISLKDLRSNQINLVLWGSRAIDFDAEGVHSVGQDSPVVAIFVGMLLKSYKGENTLSGGSSCKWYINEEIPEIEKFFDRMLGAHVKVEWVSVGEQQFGALEQQGNLQEKTVMQLRDMDPWEFEGSGYRCTVTISRINDKQPWWFSSCLKCHRASSPCGNQYKCSGGCPCTAAEPKYRLSLVGTDGTATAEFTLFGRVARQIVGKPVISLIRSASKNQHGSSGADFEHMLPELAALVSQKFTFSVSINQKNLTRRNVSFQVNGIVTFYGKQTHIPTQRDLICGSDLGSSAILSSPALNFEDTDVSTPQKKLRLERKAIPCRKTLTFHTSDNSGEDASLVDKHGGIKDARTTTEDSVVQAEGTENSSVVAGASTTNDSAPINAQDSGAEKIIEAPHSGGKQRAGCGRKRAPS